MEHGPRDVDTPAEVLAVARRSRSAADRAEADILHAAVAWVAMHPVESIVDVATLRHPSCGETPVPVAGPGAPFVAEFAVAEFAAAVGLGTESGKRLIGEAVELRYRLPRLWARVASGDLAAWKARRVAEETMELSMEGAAFVDQHVASFAHRLRPAQLRRVVEEAIARHLPELSDEAAREAADRRHVTVIDDEISFAGTMRVEAELDLADALDFEAAVARGAAEQRALGSEEPLGARRARAVGEMSRSQLALDLAAADASASVVRRTARQHILYLHLSESAVTGGSGGLECGRLDSTRAIVTADQVRTWLGEPGTSVIVKPVIDLADHVRVDQWEVPDRIAERVQLRDGHCVFPWCTRPARSCRPDQRGCDCDHVDPHARGGPTCPCNLALLCRRHHRLKTHSGWRYDALEPGSYLWTSPHGYQFLVDHEGTLDVSADRRRLISPPSPHGDPPER